jgi:hypothetical protein
MALVGEMKDVYSVLVGKPGRKRPLGRPKQGLDSNFKMDLQGAGWGSWTGLNWLRMGTGGELMLMRCFNLRVP